MTFPQHWIYLRYFLIVFSRNIWTEKTITQYIEELSMNAQNLVAQDTVHYVQETGRPNNPGNKKTNSYFFSSILEFFFILNYFQERLAASGSNLKLFLTFRPTSKPVFNWLAASRRVLPRLFPWATTSIAKSTTAAAAPSAAACRPKPKPCPSCTASCRRSQSSHL